MNFNSNEEIRDAFQGLLKIQDEKEDVKFQSQMIMYRFLSEVEILCERTKMTKKQLAEKIGTSASYITQLYSGNKPLNMETLAKFQQVFDVTFEITTKANPKVLNQDESVMIDMNHLLQEKFKLVQNQIAQEPVAKYAKKKVGKNNFPNPYYLFKFTGLSHKTLYDLSWKRGDTQKL